jgi:hypothetical protein
VGEANISIYVKIRRFTTQGLRNEKLKSHKKKEKKRKKKAKRKRETEGNEGRKTDE